VDKKIINKRESELSSIECERHSLSGLCLYPEILPEIDLWVKEIDYYNDCHQTIFLVLKQIIW
jgi:replicative DNA helicase